MRERMRRRRALAIVPARTVILVATARPRPLATSSPSASLAAVPDVAPKGPLQVRPLLAQPLDGLLEALPHGLVLDGLALASRARRGPAAVAGARTLPGAPLEVAENAALLAQRDADAAEEGGDLRLGVGGGAERGPEDVEEGQERGDEGDEAEDDGDEGEDADGGACGDGVTHLGEEADMK
ncbi:hypothetical protein FH972_021623 [Carpinus fangiana]|uniref:Uncharacterized protein n=1 Tax=Carpinus fangiana TaxID=176857 RepID=A0A5N6KQ77_9ROSI|nr:hypothetical protein FH972_021623 [Carpinus fangiana]